MIKLTKHEERFRVYIEYIRNTKLEPLAVSIFNEDWEPVGPSVCRSMVDLELIQVRSDGIYLRPDLVERSR